MLKTSLESQGLQVERLQVVPHPAAASAGSNRSHDQGQSQQQQGERANGRSQDAAEGESRGRRDGEPHGGSKQTNAHDSRERANSFHARMAHTLTGAAA